MWRYPVWKRTIVMSAGSVTHFILAIVALWFAAIFVGLPNPDCRRTPPSSAPSPAVIEVGDCVQVETVDRAQCAAGRPDVAGPAAAAGLQDGDLITAVGGTPVATYGQLTDAIRALEAGAGRRSTYERDGAAPAPRTVNLVAAAARRRWTTRAARSPQVAVAGVGWTIDRAGAWSPTARSTRSAPPATTAGRRGRGHLRGAEADPGEGPGAVELDHRRRARPGHPDQRGRRQPARRRGGRGRRWPQSS